MSQRFALIIDPVGADEAHQDYSGTFTVVDATAPALSVGELSTQRGDGVFESIGVVDAHAQEVLPHLERLANSARICDLPEPNREQWRQAVAVAAAQCPPGEYVIKLILSRGVEQGPTPTAWVTAAPAPDVTDARSRGVTVITLDRGYPLDVAERAPWLLLGAKTLSYAVNMATLREARRRGADDAIFLSSDGYVLEAPTASLILRFGDRFITPSPNGGILHGTTQLSVFEYLEGRGFGTGYEQIPASALSQVDAAWLVSSVRLAVSITKVDANAILTDSALTADLNRYLLSPRD